MRERGFSLAELLMALLILTLVITMSMAAFIERNRRQAQAREIILVYQALANESEYWRRIDFDALDEPKPKFWTETTLLNPIGPHAAIVAVTKKGAFRRDVTLTIRWAGGKREARLGIVRVNTGGSSLW
jgi:prepilin-type N-terminal cleavage/methylation domain-containing protein